MPDIDLTWSEDNTDETGHKIYHDTSSMANPPTGGAATPIATLDPNVEAYTHTDVAAGNTHYYRVSAYRTGADAQERWSDQASLLVAMSGDYILYSDQGTTSGGTQTLSVTPSAHFDASDVDGDLTWNSGWGNGDALGSSGKELWADRTNTYNFTGGAASSDQPVLDIDYFSDGVASMPAFTTDGDQFFMGRNSADTGDSHIGELTNGEWEIWTVQTAEAAAGYGTFFTTDGSESPAGTHYHNAYWNAGAYMYWFGGDDATPPSGSGGFAWWDTADGSLNDWVYNDEGGGVYSRAVVAWLCQDNGSGSDEVIMHHKVAGSTKSGDDGYSSADVAPGYAGNLDAVTMTKGPIKWWGNLEGSLAEVFVFQETLSSVDRGLLHSYFNSKYGI